MNNFSIDIYRSGMTPRQLAEAVIEYVFGEQVPALPIDPFWLMKGFGITYQFMEFKDLEGIYVAPKDEKDVAVVGINYGRPLTRQRFTAAHELCHHLKDRRNEACPIEGKGDIERFAEKFAAELLMPANVFRSVAMESAQNGKVSLDQALLIAERFGVSFRSCVLRLAYDFNMLDGDCMNLNKRISQYKPDAQKKIRGIDIENINLLRQAVNSYTFFFSMQESIVWYRFKNDFIYNENRMEGLKLDEDEVAEIITDLRLNGQESAYCKEEYEEIIQVVGHSEIYDYIFKTKDKLSIFKLLDLNKKLFTYAPFPDEAGKTRTDNNLVLGAKFETIDWHDVTNELVKLCTPVEELVMHSKDLEICDYLLEVVKIHHRITQIHPFRDGNGRCSRALLNWMLRVKGLPPIYIKCEEKEKYYKALELADRSNNYNELLRVVIREMFRTMLRMTKDL